MKLGAPAKIDAMNRFADWLGAVSRKDLRTNVVVAQMLAAYDSSSADPWLWQLTEYRNLFLHRRPFGSDEKPQFLTYEVVSSAGVDYPRIALPLSDGDPSAPGQDALARFIVLYRAMTSLGKLAADNAPYAADPPLFTVK
mgnify:FL=1